MFLDSGQDAFAPTRRTVEVVARRAEQGSTLGDDALKVVSDEWSSGVFAGQAGPAVGYADDLVTVSNRHLADGPNGRVEAGRVATRRKNTDTQCNSSEPNRLNLTQGLRRALTQCRSEFSCNRRHSREGGARNVGDYETGTGVDSVSS